MGNGLPHGLGRSSHWADILGGVEGKVNLCVTSSLWNYAVGLGWEPLGIG